LAGLGEGHLNAMAGQGLSEGALNVMGYKSTRDSLLYYCMRLCSILQKDYAHLTSFPITPSIEQTNPSSTTWQADMIAVSLVMVPARRQHYVGR